MARGEGNGFGEENGLGRAEVLFVLCVCFVWWLRGEIVRRGPWMQDAVVRGGGVFVLGVRGKSGGSSGMGREGRGRDT